MKKNRKASLVVAILLTACLMLLMTLISYGTSCSGFLEEDFAKISEGGFGDPMNNYAWSMTSFNGDLYVGTGRNIPYMMGLTFKLAGIIPWETTLEGITHPDGVPPPPFGPAPYTPDPNEVKLWAEDMRGEIWRYHCGTWEMVHKASTFVNPFNGYTYPEGIGYRIMITFNDAIYAGVGVGFGRTLLIMSTNGENWIPVNTASIPTPGDTRALAVHNGKLYLGTSGGLSGGGVGEIYASSNPSPTTDTWEKIVDFGPDNTAIVSLISFNGYLYATTQNINGFEVWRSNAQAPEDPTDEWTCIVSGGAGDAWNVWGGTTESFNDHLYVGSMSLPIPPLGLKGFDLIRIDTQDHWELIVGSYKPGAPTVPRGPPISGWPAGFANPLNFYCWSLQEHCGYLYLGTFDASAFLRYITPDMIQSLLNEETLMRITEELHQSGVSEEHIQELIALFEEGDIPKLIEKLWQHLGGADLWKSCDGIHWIPVSMNGFDNPCNYGFRTLVSTSDGLYVGTSNPWEGCEVWVARKGTIVSCDENGNVKFQFYPNENVYVKGERFPPCKNVMIYVIPNGKAPEPGNAVVSSLGTTDLKGKLPITQIWESPLDLGEYDVWVDVNQNGEYDCCDVFVERCIDIYLFMVIPEFSGSIVAVLAMISSTAVYALSKKHKYISNFR